MDPSHPCLVSGWMEILWPALCPDLLTGAHLWTFHSDPVPHSHCVTMSTSFLYVERFPIRDSELLGKCKHTCEHRASQAMVQPGLSHTGGQSAGQSTRSAEWFEVSWKVQHVLLHDTQSYPWAFVLAE